MKLQLVENWHLAWRWASIRLAAVAGAAAGVMTASPDLLIGLLNFLPDGPLRAVTVVVVTVVVFLVPVMARLLKKEEAPADE